MKRIALLCICLALPLVAAEAASAQMLPPGTSQFSPPPPAPPPPPTIELPVVPKMDAAPAQAAVQPSARGNFSDRVTTCLDEGAASGLGPNARAAYSRSCAN